MTKSIICIKVPKRQGEKAIALARKLGFLDKSLQIRRDAENLYIPSIRQPNANDIASLMSQALDYQLETKGFCEKQPPIETLMHALENRLPPHLLKNVPQAIDIIGDIAIFEIPPELKPYENAIGGAILQTHRNIRTALAKAGAISGIYRVREFTFIAGEQKTQTVHREFGCRFHVDVAKAYFSPRLSQEHQRVASLVQSGETVVDLFAGVGPFSVLIGKNKPELKVYAVDINPDAVELLKINVRVNRVENRVFPILGNARQITGDRLKGLADRVIMNLPETAIEFVDSACHAIKPQGGVIHFYAFVRSPDSTENLKFRFSQAVESAGRKVETFLYAKSIRETAPFQSQIVLDAKVV